VLQRFIVLSFSSAAALLVEGHATNTPAGWADKNFEREKKDAGFRSPAALRIGGRVFRPER
jgi:hypothetical protein